MRLPFPHDDITIIEKLRLDSIEARETQEGQSPRMSYPYVKRHPIFGIFRRVSVRRRVSSKSERTYISPQGKAVSNTNLLINLNRLLDDYEEKMREERAKDESSPDIADSTEQPVYRLDRKDRDTDVQDACRVHSLSRKESFLRSCEQAGIPPFAMTYFLDRITSGDSEVSMRNLGIGPDGASAVAEALARNSKVTKLDLSLNNIRDEGAVAVARLLEMNSLIVSVNLSENKIAKEGADAIANMLTLNDSLRHFDFSRNSLTDDSVQLFANTLQTDDALETVDLSHNAFSTKAGEYLGDMIRNNSSLKELSLGWNHFGDAGAKPLCAGIKENRTLEKVDLCWNEIGHRGAVYIADVLEHNARLLELNINNNHITDRGMERIGRSLVANDTLRVLRAGFNLITEAGACSLLRSLAKNPGSALERVYMAEVVVTSAVKESYLRLKLVNPKIQLLEMSSPSGDIYHFIQPPNPMKILDDYISRNQLNRRLLSIGTEEDADVLDERA